MILSNCLVTNHLKSQYTFTFSKVIVSFLIIALPQALKLKNLAPNKAKRKPMLSFAFERVVEVHGKHAGIRAIVPIATADRKPLVTDITCTISSTRQVACQSPLFSKKQIHIDSVLSIANLLLNAKEV